MTWFTYIFFLSFLNSIVFGFYLPNSKGNHMNKTANKSWNISSRSIGLNRALMWSGSFDDNGQWIVKVPYLNNLEPELHNRFFNMVNEFQRHTCIHWVPRTNEWQYVNVHSDPPANWPADRCRANIGKYKLTSLYVSKQCLGLTPYSGMPRTVNLAHEMFHTLNFAHEHQRKDRDCYVEISGHSLISDFNNYGIYTHQNTDLTFPYDEESIMQYPDPGMRSKFNKQLGPLNDFPNQMDWMKVNYHYCKKMHYCQQQDSIAIQRCQRHQQITEQCYRQG